MGADLYEYSDAARACFDEANEVLGFSLTDMMFAQGEEAAETLKQTEVTQPALYVHSLATLAAMREAGAPEPDLAAGHSLGEYSALAAAGAFSFADGLRVVRRRGELMATAGEDRPGAMAAVLGLNAEAVEQVCEKASTDTGVVVPANYNDPGQIVISGDDDAVTRARGAAADAGARRVIALPVSGAFHSPLMAYAHDGLAEALHTLEITAPECPVILNVTAEPTTDPDAIREGLLDQLTSPVRWAQSVGRMQSEGATRFVEVGSGAVLSGLVRRTLGRDADTMQVGTTDDVEAFSK